MTTGRPAKPSEFEGTLGNRRVVNNAEVSFVNGAPLPPWWYGQDAKATEAWDGAVALLKEAGLLTKMDGPNLAIYAYNVSREEKIGRYLADPSLDSRERGRLTKEYKDACLLVKTMSDSYGFTALSRQKIGGTKPSGEVANIPDGQTHGENVIDQLTGNA